MSRNHVLILVIVGCLIAAAAAFFRPTGVDHGANNANFPDGTYWICDSPQCGERFNLSMEQLNDHHARHYGEPLPCPKCGKTEVTRAMVDDSGKWVRVTRGGPEEGGR